MASVGLFEAKTHLSALVERAARGEEITITKHGAPVARLVSVRSDPDFDRQAWVLRARQLRRGATLGDMTIRELIHSGRRY